MAMGGRCLKVFGGGVVVVALLCGVGWLRRDAILEGVLEDQLGSVTGVVADIGTVKTEPFQGNVSLEAVTLNNPEGFSSPYALQLDRLDLSVDPNTILGETVIINSLVVSGIRVNLEQTLQKNNFAKLVDNVDEQTSSRSGPGGGGKKVKIVKLMLRDIDASVKLSVIGGLGVQQTLEIDDVVVTDVTAENVEGRILEAVTAAILDELAGVASAGRLLK